MGLRLKFNLVLILVFALGLGGLGLRVQAHPGGQRAGGGHPERRADDGARRSRCAATPSKQVKPQLELQLSGRSCRRSVPAYAATETFNDPAQAAPGVHLQGGDAQPHQPADRAVDWEADIVQQFRNGGDRHGDPRRARHAHRPRAVPGPADQDHRAGVPRRATARRRRRRSPWSSSTGTQRLRLEAQGDRSARRSSRCRCRCRWQGGPGLPHLHDLAGGSVRPRLHRAERGAFPSWSSGRSSACPGRPTRSAPGTSTSRNFRWAAATRSVCSATSFNRLRSSLEKAMKLLE